MIVLILNGVSDSYHKNLNKERAVLILVIVKGVEHVETFCVF